VAERRRRRRRMRWWAFAIDAGGEEAGARCRVKCLHYTDT